jgi:hypothetical protein
LIEQIRKPDAGPAQPQHHGLTRCRIALARFAFGGEPNRYVAELVGTDPDSERATRWLIALMVLCCDPLAIALTAAATARRSEARGDEQSEVETVHSIR